jgi:protein TonB
MRSRSIPFWISAFLHLAVVGTAALLFVKPPEFAMDSGKSSVEVNLVAANPDPTPPVPAPPQPEEPADEQPPQPDDVTVPVAPPLPPPPTPPAEIPPPVHIPPPSVVPPKPHVVPTVAKGDGSAPKPGKDATTASSEGGAIMDAKPDYLSNPPPLYPESCRLNKQEGLAVLSVIVGTDGRPETISLQTGSGFSALDQAALEAVRKWRFRPASLGSLKVKSRVTIPIRFRLNG